MAQAVSRRNFVRGAVALAAAGAASSSAALSAPRTLADAGWCWDGQGFNGGVNPSIFGAGEGTRWFGLKRCCHMFHPNNDLAMEKLAGFEEVVCEISKWKVRRCDNGVAHFLDGSIATKTQEAAQVSALSRRYRNVSGAVDDDLLGIIKREKIKPEQYALVYEALKKENPRLKLWTVVYDRELQRENWAGFEPFADVVNLCVGNQTEDFSHLGRYLDQCAEIFPGKPVNLVYRLRDFRLRPPGPVPMEPLAQHWADIRSFVAQGRLSGYSILGGFLIDMHPQQARWVRDFIQAH